MKTVTSIVSSVVLVSALSLSAQAGQYNPDQLKQFEQTNTCKNCDLQHASMAGITHNKANLEGSDLRGVQAHGANFIEANLAKTNWELADLSSANLSGADLSGANLTGVNFQFANLTDAKISEAQLKQAANICDAILPDGKKSPCK